MANFGSQAINCGVHSCRFNDKSTACTLSDIVVGQEQSAAEAMSKHDTVCGSFEAE